VAVSDAKEDPLDFVLWKAAKAEDPEDTKWDSPYGVGRPGWHIECSAMSRDLLGLPLDIHGGGPDLKFPHHENEIAQSEGAYGGSLANLWMHCGPLMVDDDKMSKSLGNFMTIRQVIAKDNVNPDVADYPYNVREAEMLRFFIVRNHYRSQQNFAPDNLNDAQVALDRFYQGLNNIGFDAVEVDWDSEHAKAFKAAMNDDFNTPVAIAVLFDMLNQANREKDRALASQMRALAGVLGILQQDPAEYLRSYSRYTRLGGTQDSAEALSEEAIEDLIQQRTEAKSARDFALADQIRDQLKEAGIELEDKPGGLTQWRRV
jgi:cysteinyl-tRNA synthetase